MKIKRKKNEHSKEERKEVKKKFIKNSRIFVLIPLKRHHIINLLSFCAVII